MNLLALVLSAWTQSPCLSPKASDAVVLVQQGEGLGCVSKVDLKSGGQVAVITIEPRVAVMQLRAAAELTPVAVSTSAWKQYRAHLDEPDGQTGCLRSFPRGTLLYDKPNGEPVAVVI